jgi:hypothetical protein
VNATAETDLGAKAAWLRRRESFSDAPDAVEANRNALRVGVPVKAVRLQGQEAAAHSRRGFHDARGASRELRVRDRSLNRRLAEAVYIGVVPLVRRDAGFALEADGDAVEGLVKMRRLPRDRMLDQAARQGAVAHADLEAVLDKLDAFYRRAARAPWDGAAYRDHLTRQIERYSTDLGLNRNRVHAAAEGLLDFVREHEGLFDAHIAAGRVVDAHGDSTPPARPSPRRAAARRADRP